MVEHVSSGIDFDREVTWRLGMPQARVLRRRMLIAAVDSALWVVALLAAIFLRYDLDFKTNSASKLVALLGAAALIAAVTGLALGLYSGRWRFGSHEESYALAGAAAITILVVLVLDLALDRPMPVGAALAAGPLAFLATGGVRSLIRVRNERRMRTSPEDAARVIVFGAGDGGANAIAAMLRDPDRCYDPVALLDDDPSKARLRIHNVSVRGKRTAMAAVAAATGADTLLIAIPSADAALIRDLADRATQAGMTTKVLPPVAELFGGAVAVSDIRPVSYADLLGRREVEIDNDSIASYLTGKRVLVTGAGGSIGSELCRQLRRYNPGVLVMLDRDESALHATQLSMDGRALLDSRSLVVADIRDRNRMAEVFAEHKPEVVFHAAALKHLPLLEMHPDEAVKSNIWGTWNMLEVAAAEGVDRFVNISTDKAADPISVLGYSKRIAERLTSFFDAHSDVTCLSVRFGNVLGSRGSVLTAFQAQIAAGNSVTVTHPDVTRYFMTVEEAVRLVIQAGAVGSSGDALVLDMGEPVRIADVARRLIEESGIETDIIYTGLRPGEKLHEVLLAADEPDLRPVHDYISHVPVPEMSPRDVTKIRATSERLDVIEDLRSAACPAVRRLESLPTEDRAGVSHKPAAGGFQRASDRPPLSALTGS